MDQAYPLTTEHTCFLSFVIPRVWAHGIFVTFVYVIDVCGSVKVLSDYQWLDSCYRHYLKEMRQLRSPPTYRDKFVYFKLESKERLFLYILGGHIG